jgi:polyhydroxyalkanoate synthesis regulator phasin
MPLVDVLRAALSKPAGKIVEVPVRNQVDEILRDHGFAGPADVAKLREEIAELRDRVAVLENRLRER